MSDYPELHVYSPPWQHEDALIIGTEAGLRQLFEVISRALAVGSGTGTTFANDGEGYAVIVARAEQAEFLKIKSHYTDEVAASSGHGDDPWNLVLGDGSAEERKAAYDRLMIDAVDGGYSSEGSSQTSAVEEQNTDYEYAQPDFDKWANSENLRDATPREIFQAGERYGADSAYGLVHGSLEDWLLEAKSLGWPIIRYLLKQIERTGLEEGQYSQEAEDVR